MLTSTTQLEELRRASRYPKFKDVLQPHRVGTMINNIKNAVMLIELPPKHELADPNDAFLLSMAEAGHADYLVTGDHRAGLLQRKHIGRTLILTPKAFCALAL